MRPMGRIDGVEHYQWDGCVECSWYYVDEEDGVTDTGCAAFDAIIRAQRMVEPDKGISEIMRLTAVESIFHAWMDPAPSPCPYHKDEKAPSQYHHMTDAALIHMLRALLPDIDIPIISNETKGEKVNLNDRCKNKLPGE